MKKDATLDMFGTVAPPKEKARKPVAKPRATIVAEVCGAIAGIPRGFKDAGEALRDVVERCRLASESKGVLTHPQLHDIEVIGDKCAAIMPQITALWKEVDAMIADRIGVEKPKVEDLF